MHSTFLRGLAARAAMIGLLSSLFVPFAASAASSAITIGTVTPTSATSGVPVTLSTGVSSSAGNITSCSLYVDNDDKGAMTISGGTASKSYTFVNAQIYTVFVFCRDSANNFNSGPNASVWAQGGSGGNGDITPPDVGSVSPATAVAGVAVTLTVNASDAGGVASCNLIVADADKGAMSIESGMASKSYVFSQPGTFVVHAQCKDTAGNTGTGVNTSVSVSPGAGGINQGSLIKLACPAGAAANHPCKAVYYYAKDGKRHAFPNEKIYFTWYANFDSVETVSSETMASFTLGKNVTYRPGSKMVKFTTVSNVYAVAKGAELRWVKTEADAVALYGADWNKKIDDISEAFFLDYHYGEDITPSAPYNVTLELNGATKIDDTL